MSSAKRILAVLLLPALFSFGACKKTATSSEAPAANPSSGLQPAGGVVSPAEVKYFRGTIGNTLGLQMKLVKQNENVAGSYSYEKVGTKIDVRGSLDKDGNLKLDEFDSSGKQTGTFAGRWTTNSDGIVEISGNWTKPNSDKKTAFSLEQEPIEFTNGAEILTRHIKEKNKKLNYEIDADYPELANSTDPNVEKFNQTVRNLINRDIAGFKKDMAPEASSEPTPDPTVAPTYENNGSDITIAYVISLAKDDLISVEFIVSSYYAGAAHPNSSSETVNFDLKNGRPLKLADLFQPGAKYLPAISAYAIKDLKAAAQKEGADGMLDDDDWVQRGAGPDLKNYRSWTITKKGLDITFDSYQVASYAAGPQHALVPYAALKDIIKPDGPLAQFVS